MSELLKRRLVQSVVSTSVWPLIRIKFVIEVETNLISREQRDVARAHGRQEGPFAIVQPLNGTGLPTMTNSLLRRVNYLQFRGGGVQINPMSIRGD